MDRRGPGLRRQPKPRRQGRLPRGDAAQDRGQRGGVARESGLDRARPGIPKGAARPGARWARRGFGHRELAADAFHRALGGGRHRQRVPEPLDRALPRRDEAACRAVRAAVRRRGPGAAARARGAALDGRREAPRIRAHLVLARGNCVGAVDRHEPEARAVRLSPRAKMLLVVAIFALPIVASFLAYHLVEPRATGNYGELLLPPATITAHPFERASGVPFRFESLRGRWIMVVSDSGACPRACVEKLTLVRQTRLSLGREAGRVARVFVADDLVPPDAAALGPFAGTEIVRTPAGLTLPPGAVNDRAHVYLVDPLGNVMMRWPAGAEGKRMLQDLKRLLK